MPLSTIRRLLAALLVVSSGPLHGQSPGRAELAPVRLGGEVVVNSERAGDQRNPALGFGPDGNLAVVWDDEDGGVYGQVYDADGVALPGAFAISSAGAYPEVAGDGEAGFIVSWWEGELLARSRLWARRLDATGHARGAAFQLDEGDCRSPDDPRVSQCRSPHRAAVTAGADGWHLAAWCVSHVEWTPHQVREERELVRALITADDRVEIEALDERGSAACDYEPPVLASRADGRSAVIATGAGLQRLDGAAHAVGEPAALPRHAADLSVADDGRFVVVWLDYAEGQGYFTRGQRRGPDLEPAGEVFRTEGFHLGTFEKSAVAADPDGHFVVVWQQSGDGSATGVFGRRYNWNWGPVGGEFQVNSVTEGDQYNPEVAVGRDGTFAVVWESQDGGGRTFDVHLQRFAPAVCVPDDETLCLQDGRFRVEVEWRDFAGAVGRGRAAPRLTRDTGYFWFFSADNVEVVVKVLDGRSANGRYWVFFGSLSNVAYTLTVTDTLTGEVRAYRNPSGRFASVGDDEAFPGDERTRDWTLDAAPPGRRSGRGGPAAPCAGGGDRLCLNDGRFEVTTRWRDFTGQTGVGHAVPLTADTGYFWFFGPRNVEVVVKALDGRRINGHFWVFYGALSNVEYTLTVSDSVTGAVREYRNPLRRFASIGDTHAFPAGL